MNTEIRAALLKTGIRQWALAEKMGVSEFTLCRWLRHELPAEKKRAALEAIRELAKEKAGGAGDGEKTI